MTTANRILLRGTALLTHPRLLPVLVVLSVFSNAPALWSGLFNDDYCQQVEILESPSIQDALNKVGLGIARPGHLGTLLSDHFIAVGAEKNREPFKTYGALPWWTGEDYQVSLLRPVAAFAAWLDLKLFGGSVFWRHLHTLLWLGLVVYGVGTLFRHWVDPPWVAGLAVLLFALDDNHYFPAMWIANRNQLISLVFAIGCLLAHHRWRVHSAGSAGLLSWTLLGASLLSAEAGIATFAYLLAYALTLDRSRWSRRLMSLVPAISLILVWRLLYNAAGYGARGGGFYFDPGNQPLAFVQGAWQRGPFMAAGQWFSLPPDLFAFIHDEVRWPYALILAVLSLVVPIFLWPLLVKERSARFWFVGMHLAIVPVCAAVPMGRNLLFCSMGGYALIAMFIGYCFASPSQEEPAARVSRWSKALCGLLILIHLPIATLAKASAPWMTQRMIQRIDATTDLGALPLEDQRPVIILNAPNPASFLYVPFKEAVQERPLPRDIRLLAPGYGPLTVTREDANTLTLRAQEASLLTCRPTTRLGMVHLYRYLSDFRAPHERVSPTTPIVFPELTLQVIAIDPQGNPIEVACRFVEPLEEMAVRWLQWDWKNEQYIAFNPPAVGQAITIKGPY